MLAQPKWAKNSKFGNFYFFTNHGSTSSFWSTVLL